MQNQDHTNEVGIDNSEIAAGIIGTAVGSIVNIDSNQDGDIQLLEGLNAVQNIAIKVIRQIPDLTALRKEFKDYTEGEKDDVIDTLSADMALPSAKARALVKRASRIVLDIIDLYIDSKRPEEDFLAPAQV